MNKLELLQQYTTLFTGLPHDLLLEASLSVQKRHYEAGECIIEQGSDGDILYMLCAGQVRIERETMGGQHRFLGNPVKAPYMFGELSVLLQVPRAATITCLTDAVVLYMHGDKLRVLGNRRPELMWRLCELMAHQLLGMMQYDDQKKTQE